MPEIRSLKFGEDPIQNAELQNFFCKNVSGSGKYIVGAEHGHSTRHASIPPLPLDRR